MSSPSSSRGRHCLFFLISLCLGVILFFCVRVSGRFLQARTIDASNLRYIAQSNFIYAQDHNNQLPHGTDIWDHARLLADSGLNSISLWQSRIDPATDKKASLGSILLTQTTGENRQLNPSFRKIKPSFAVAIGELNIETPATTPLIWTRGLQSNGTWSKHSPYGTEGGLITFLGGNTAYYLNLSDNGGQLVRFDGKGQTANILEALPPGTKISEYVPTAAEAKKWSRTNWQRALVRHATNLWSVGLIFLAIIFTPVFGFSKHTDKISTCSLIVISFFLVLLTVAIASV